MKNFWNDRYRPDEYVYGKEPNEFLKSTLLELELTGKALFPAEGEGRNAVFAATLGLGVNAFDISIQAKNKALNLAKQQQVNIDYLVGTLDELTFEENSFDCVVLIYAHFPAKIRSKYHQQLSKLLRKGGVLIFEAFSKANLDQKKKYPEIGGPSNVEMLFSKEEIEDDFNNFEVIELSEKIISLHEGDFHKGKGAVIRFIGKKK